MSSNDLITNKPSDSPLNVQLHPLVLLTISDYVTRHISRQQQGLMVGAIIGQQNGRNFTLEHAYECRHSGQDNRAVLDAAWFQERLEQYKDVHKVPQLDLVALFMIGPVSGPQRHHADLIQQACSTAANDGVMLLLFHPELVDELQGGKLPITLYENVAEHEGEDVLYVKFREQPFEVETGDAERIGVDAVAQGAGNAAAVPAANMSAFASISESSNKEKQSKGKGKGKAKDKDGASETNGVVSEGSVLSPEDEELLAALTAKSNAIKMLNQRLNLIRSYLTTLPPSYLSDAASADPPAESTNHTLLRSINSMLSHLPLLAPPSPASNPGDEAGNTQSLPSNLSTAREKEKQDVQLTQLLATLARSVSEAQTLAGRFNIMQRDKQAKQAKERGGGGARDKRMNISSDGDLLLEDEGGL